MKRTSFLIAAALLALFSTAQASNLVYYVKLNPHSPVKDVKLENKQVQLQLYAFGNPIGMQVKTLDKNATFTLKNGKGKSFVVELVSVKGLPKNVFCSGYAAQQETDINLICRNSR